MSATSTPPTPRGATADASDVPTGYKRTDLTIIPNDWELRRLGDIGECLIGLTYDPRHVRPAGLLVLRSSNIGDGGLRFDDNLFVGIEVPDRLIVRDRDLLICVRNGSRPLIGKSVLINRRAASMTFGAFMAIFRSAYNEFVSYCFQSNFVMRQIHEHLGATINQITNKSLKSFQIPFPSLEEQRVISTALSDVDALLAALEALIAKKQAIKQAATQKLLTGKTRLPGYTGVWHKRRISDMGDVLTGKALDAHGVGTLRPYLRTKNVLDGRIDLDDVLWMPMTDVEFARFRIEPGDVLLNEGQSLELVGRCSMYRGELGSPCAMQNQLLRFRANERTSPEFAAHLFRYCQRTGVFAAIATQTTSVAHLGSSRFSNLQLLWPSGLREQASIAAILSDMDAEIAGLEARRDKTRAIKQGMMQQLLTGRVRLVAPTSAQLAAC